MDGEPERPGERDGGAAGSSASLKVPPHDLEAEQAVLGGLMLDNAAWDRIADRLHEDDFYRREHRLIYRTMGELAEVNQPLDVVTLSGALRQHGALDDAGGMAYVGSLARETPSAANIRAYADIVRERSVLRQLIRAGSDVAEAAFQPEGRGSEELLDHAERVIFRIAEQTGRHRQGFIGMRDLVPEVVNRIDQLYQRQAPVTGLPTGFDDLDHLTSGLQRGDLVIVAGRPSMGKCLAWDAEIVLEDGSITTMEEMHRRRAGRIGTLRDDGQLGWRAPSDFVDDGRKPVFEVRTALGRRVETTWTHPFLTPEGWRPLGELAVGEPVAVPGRCPVSGRNPLPGWEVRLLAYFLAEGGRTATAPWLTRAPAVVREDFAGAVDEARIAVGQVAGGGAEAPEDETAGSPASTLEALVRLRWRSGERQRRSEARLPACVFTLPREQLATFLNRFLAASRATGGCVLEDDRLTYRTAHEGLARDLQHTLLRFGVLGRLRAVGDGDAAEDDAPRWRLEVSDRVSLEAFATEVGVLGGESGVAVLVAHGGGDAPPPGDGDIIWDRIEEIRPLGRKQVYDLTVPGTHNFVANDVCVHNTTFAMNMVEHVAMQERLPVAVFSMEMPAEALAMRMLASLGRVQLQRVRSGRLRDDDWPRLTSTMSLLSEAPLFVDDTGGLTPTEVRARARRLLREQGQLGLVVIDYLQLMQISHSRENRASELSEISRSLKGLAKELDTPVVALSQLNRSLEQRPNKRPVMSDLRECVAGETPVVLADGARVPIEQLVGTTPEVRSMDGDGRVVPATAEKVWRVGRRPVHRLRLVGGGAVRATARHRFYGADGWRRLDELSPGERIAVADAREAAADRPGWQTIEGIEPDGEENVYDLTVPETASWLADGVVSHNSGAIEQDADVIAFIYRDEVYDENSPDKGIAEVIVGKQRQGPIGTVKLTFLGEYTRFENHIDDVYGGPVHG